MQDKDTHIKAEEIDALLPQTQCGLCGYGGCLPYAEALAERKAPINLCSPGGTSTLFELAEILKADPAPYLRDMEKKTKQPTYVVIREDECIGCTKCIQACPVDAIVGSAKCMHTVLMNECTGCELCIPACPVDCIDIRPLSALLQTKDYFRQKFNKKKARLKKQSLNEGTKSQMLDTKTYLKNVMLRKNLAKS